MTGLSAAGESAVLTPLTTTAYVSLHTADPGPAGGGEIAGGGYARQGPVAFANAGANPTVASNSVTLTYSATASWGTLTFFGLWDSATAGNFRGSGPLNAPITVNSGDVVRFLANSLTITVD
jgi:hypothetical protein